MTTFSPCPKPLPTVKPPRGVRKRSKHRTADEKRIYGPTARRKWVSLQPCSACGVWGFSQGAHVLGNDGAGRKQDYKTIAPLCTVRPATPTELAIKGAEMWPGCHHLFDEAQDLFRAYYPMFNAAKAARECEKAWRRFCATPPAAVPREDR